jgi:hypothetical protein
MILMKKRRSMGRILALIPGSRIGIRMVRISRIKIQRTAAMRRITGLGWGVCFGEIARDHCWASEMELDQHMAFTEYKTGRNRCVYRDRR